jgi:hypothetical protein
MHPSHPLPEPPDTAPRCTYVDPTGIGPDDTDVVEPALAHMADAAFYVHAAMTRNSAYRADAGVAALTRTVAATADIAMDLDAYLSDVWPGAVQAVARAHGHLVAARVLLDTAHRHCAQTPSALQRDDIHHRAQHTSDQPPGQNPTRPDSTPDTGTA